MYFAVVGSSLLSASTSSRAARWAKLNRLISPNGSNQAFSSFKTSSKVLSMFNELTSYYQQQEKPIPEEALSRLHCILCVFNKPKSNNSLYSESFLCHYFLYAIIATVCCEFDDVEITVEEMIAGKLVFAHGKFEFLIKRGTIKICIVESKTESVNHGIVQALAGSEVLAELENLCLSLCIVTTYRQWIFFKNYNDRITKCDFLLIMESAMSLVPTLDSLKTLTSLLHSFLILE